MNKLIQNSVDNYIVQIRNFKNLLNYLLILTAIILTLHLLSEQQLFYLSYLFLCLCEPLLL